MNLSCMCLRINDTVGFFVIISCENETAYERKKGERNRLNLVLNRQIFEIKSQINL